MEETGWLLDDGNLCVGASWCTNGFVMVTYTDSQAIRFAREEDVSNFRHALLGLQFKEMIFKCKPVEHSWS